MKRNLALATVAAAAMLCSGASATITLTPGVFGSQFGVHSNNSLDETGNTVFGTVGIGGSQVTFTSTNTLFLNGQGEAIIDANPLTNLNVSFAQTNTFSQVTFDIEAITNGTFNLSVNGGAATFTNTALSGNGANKFLLTGTNGETFNTLAFTFTPGVDDLKQFRLQTGGGAQIPEPATWAMMLIGFGGLGAVLRSKRRHRNLAFA
jgi:PEP-CTERM motif